MAKRIDYGKDAFDKLKSGARKLHDAVCVTMGAKGRNVLIEAVYETDPPHITKDGITVAKAVQLRDPVEKLGCNLIKSASLRANEAAGDGSTTAVSLAYAILNYGADAVEKGANPVMIKRGIDIELRNTLEYLDSMAEPISDDSLKTFDVALVSANGDEKIASLISEVYKEIGAEGNVAIEPDLNSPECSYFRVDGLEFDRGYNNPYFVTDIPTETVEYEDPLILISDYKIMNIKELKNVINIASDLGRPLVIISEDIDPDADNLLAVNKLQNGFRVVSINTPEFGDRRLNFLEDLATVTGGKFISTVTGKTYDDVEVEDFGQCSKIIVTRESTSIIGGKGSSDEISDRLESIKSQIPNAKTDEHKEYLNKRYAKLKGGFVVIKVGANSDVERVEIKDRVEDAVNAVKAALKEGVIAGGGAPLLRVSLTPLIENENEYEDVTEGRKVLKKSLKIPFNQILFNAGITDVKSVAEDVIEAGNEFVYDVIKDEIVNGFEEGIIDPVLVTKSALINSASVSGTLLTTGCTISFDPDEETTLKV